MSSVIPTEKFVTVNGLKLRYIEWGSSDNPPMVCLHGHTGQARIWDRFAEAMSPHYHVFALDQRGHGESQWAADGYDRDRFVEDLGAFLDALRLPRATLVGLSMGGWHAMLYTPDHQDRVERIVMVDIGPEPSEESRRLWQTREPPPLEFAAFEDAVAFARQANPWVSDEDLRTDLRNRLRRRPDGGWVWKADPALLASRLRDGDDADLISRYWRGLATIACPILEVRGSESPLVSGETLERMKAANPLLSSVDVEGAGHVVVVDRPQAFIDATREFLALSP